MKNTIIVDGITYERKQERKGNRCFVVVDHGWIYAGNVEDRDGRVLIHNAVWVFRWSKIGLTAVLENPLREEVDIRSLPNGCTTVDLPASSEVYRIQVPDDWGVNK